MRSSLFIAMALALGTGLSAAPLETQAQSAREVLKSAESTMVLTGEIDIGTEGQVEGFRLDKRERIPEALVPFVEQQVNSWRFEPVQVEGKPVAAKTPVTLRLIARPDAGGGTNVSLAAANFEQYRDDATDRVTRLTTKPPTYPRSVFDQGGRGEVLLLVKVGRDGKVEEVFAEQVNLRVYGREREMTRMRDELARASVAAARDWTYRVPVTGEQAGKTSWNVRVPVNFAIGGRGDERGYGRWESYIPGPRLRAPWREPVAAADVAADLLPSGGVYMADVNNGPRLLTPLGS